MIDKNTPLISVVMPVHNGEKFLGEAIESVLNQTFSNFEFIIVNDGSTDRTGDIIEKCAQKDQRIICLNNENKLGQSTTRNKAIRQAIGTYVALADADDVSLSSRFMEQVEYMKNHPKIDVLGAYFCLSAGGPIDECRIVPAYVHDVRNGKPPVHNPTCMIKRKTFLDFGYYDSKYDNAEDVELWFRWFSRGVRFENMAKVLYKKRIHEGSVSISKIRHQMYLLLKINIIALSRYRVRFTSKGYLRILEQAFYLLYLFLRLDRIYVRDKAVYNLKRKAKYEQ